MSDFGVIAFMLVVVILGVFAWLVKTMYDFRKAADAGFADVEHKIAGLEDAAIALKKELDKIDSALDNKIDKHYLDERVDSLLKALKKKR